MCGVMRATWIRGPWTRICAGWREKLGKASDYVETVRGVGYRFADAP